MKKLFSNTSQALTVATALIMTFSSFKVSVMPEQPASKAVEIILYSNADYSSEVYKKSKAKVQVTILKYAKKKFQEVYNGTLQVGSLSELPMEENAIVKSIKVAGFDERNELLVAKCTFTYESDGAVLTYDKYVILADAKNKKELKVTL